MMKYYYVLPGQYRPENAAENIPKRGGEHTLNNCYSGLKRRYSHFDFCSIACALRRF